MADRSQVSEVTEPPVAEFLRSRLRQVAAHLHEAILSTKNAGFPRLAQVITECADEIDGLVDATPLPPTRSVECAIARGERAVDVWRSVIAF